MGLMDRVKAQATQLAQKTQEAAQEGKSRLDQAQANRRGDAMLRQLGIIVYQDRTGRGSPDSQVKIDNLISDLSARERENGLNLGDQSESTMPPQSTVPPQSNPTDPPAGGPAGYPPEGTGFPPEGSGPDS
jgi:hypothetical protein